MYNKEPAPPEISVTVLLLSCSCLWSSASRDLLEIRVIFKRSRALRDQRPNRILKWSDYNSYVCFVQTLDNKSCLHIAIHPGQQAVCRYVWEEIPSHPDFSSSCWNLAGVSLLFFLPIVLPSLTCALVAFPWLPPVFISWSEKAASKYIAFSSEVTVFLYVCLSAFLSSPLNRCSQVGEDCRKELFRGSSTLDGYYPKTHKHRGSWREVVSF